MTAITDVSEKSSVTNSKDEREPMSALSIDGTIERAGSVLQNFADERIPSGTLSNVHGIGDFLKGVNPALTLVASALDGFRMGQAVHADGNTFGVHSKHTLSAVVGSVAGSEAGSIAGEPIGQAVGAVLGGALGGPPGLALGEIIGGAGGSVLGSIVGSIAGSRCATEVSDHFFGAPS